MNRSRSISPRRLDRIVLTLLATVLLAGCASLVRLMPTPVTFRNSDVDPFEKAGTTVKGTDLPVMYITNRGALVEKPEPLKAVTDREPELKN